MEFFGLTSYGPQNPIADMVLDKYKTPTNKEAVKPLMEKVMEYSTLPKTVSWFIFSSYLLVIGEKQPFCTVHWRK